MFNLFFCFYTGQNFQYTKVNESVGVIVVLSSKFIFMHGMKNQLKQLYCLLPIINFSAMLYRNSLSEIS